jgi:hypothetical protein
MRQRQRERLEATIVEYTPRIVGVLCVVVMLLVAASVYLSFQYQETNQEIDENQQQQVYNVREGQYVNCIRTGNALRRQVRREFIGLKRDILIPVFSRVAHTIPRGAPARRILTGTVVYMHKRIRTIESRIPNVDCAKRYPPLPGQSYEQVRPDRNGGGDGRTTQVRPSGEPPPNSGPASPGQSDPPSSGGSPGGGGSSPPAPTQPPTTEPPSPPTPPAPPPAPPSPGSPSPNAVDEVQGIANDTVDGVQENTCKLAPVLC